MDAIEAATGIATVVTKAAEKGYKHAKSKHCRHCPGTNGPCLCTKNCPAKHGISECSVSWAHCRHCRGVAGYVCTCTVGCIAEQKVDCMHNVVCKLCHTRGLEGLRYTCRQEADYDICEECYSKSKDLTRSFWVIEYPGAPAIDPIKLSTTTNCLSSAATAGSVGSCQSVSSLPTSFIDAPLHKKNVFQKLLGSHQRPYSSSWTCGMKSGQNGLITVKAAGPIITGKPLSAKPKPLQPLTPLQPADLPMQVQQPLHPLQSTISSEPKVNWRSGMRPGQNGLITVKAAGPIIRGKPLGTKPDPPTPLHLLTPVQPSKQVQQTLPPPQSTISFEPEIVASPLDSIPMSHQSLLSTSKDETKPFAPAWAGELSTRNDANFMDPISVLRASTPAVIYGAPAAGRIGGTTPAVAASTPAVHINPLMEDPYRRKRNDMPSTAALAPSDPTAALQQQAPNFPVSFAIQPLSFFSTPDELTLSHLGVTCDGYCQFPYPITGPRFRCAVCPDVDLCEGCYFTNQYCPGHVFSRITDSTTEPHELPRRDTSLIQHPNIACGYCHTMPIVGFRYSCCEFEFELCHACFVSEHVYAGHEFDRITHPGAMKQRLQPRSNTVEEGTSPTVETSLESPGTEPAVAPFQNNNDLVLHPNIMCDGCNIYPLVGIRVECQDCRLDFCEPCVPLLCHEHCLVRYDRPGAVPAR